VYAVFSRDMRTIAVGGTRGEVRLVDVRTHTVRALPSPMTNLVFGLEFGPHGVLAASDAGHVVLYSHLASAHPRMRDASRATHAVGFGMDLSPDGRMLAVATKGNSIGFFDARTLRRIGPVVPTSGNLINWVAFDRTATKLVTGDAANLTRLIDVPSRQQIGPVLGNNIAGGGSVFSHDGRTLGTWTFASGVLMSLDPAVWRREACAIAGRNLTTDEWSKYLPGQGPRRRTCPQFS
jgi:WD40 repeat protein